MIKRSTLTLACITLLFTGCHRTSRETWEDTKTCGRYMSKGLRTLFGQHEDVGTYTSFNSWSDESEFIPMARADDSYDALEMADYIPPSKESPGDPNSPLPGVERFSYPSGRLAELFANISFETDQYSIIGEDNVRTMHEIAKYLISKPNTYIFVEGHADERGAAAYNLALGSRRANAVRAFLIQNGVNPDQLFTISYGKERPLSLGHDQVAWHQNRRAQFRLYDR